jgi:hypothetical protein
LSCAPKFLRRHGAVDRVSIIINAAEIPSVFTIGCRSFSDTVISEIHFCAVHDNTANAAINEHPQ